MRYVPATFGKLALALAVLTILFGLSLAVYGESPVWQAGLILLSGLVYLWWEYDVASFDDERIASQRLFRKVSVARTDIVYWTVASQGAAARQFYPVLVDGDGRRVKLAGLRRATAQGVLNHAEMFEGIPYRSPDGQGAPTS